ncbi:MAG: hypothetical protein JXA78_01285 [Anaerolineales bacterium]|nr:hypothetical protein [Anaerolineales bacterium]
MRIKWVILAVTLAFLSVGAMIASASALEVDETNLAASGEAYEANFGTDGKLYISDYEAKQIWVIDPAVGDKALVYWLYDLVVDARPDSNGDIWWTDARTTFGVIDTQAESVTTWGVAAGHNLWGVTFDQDGKVWMTEFTNATSRLYRFDPVLTELCTYTLPLAASSHSYYIFQESGELWLANWFLDRIYRVDPANMQADWWQIPDGNSWAVGLAMDNSGTIWWADYGLHLIANLDPNTDGMTQYPLPVGQRPQMLALQGQKIWYTEEISGTFGLFDPTSTAGFVSTLITGTGGLSKVCMQDYPVLDSYGVITTSVSLSWSSSSLEPIVDDGAWTVYQLPAGAEPYGINYTGDRVWVVDQDRRKLVRFSVQGPEFKVYLPLVTR